MLKYAVLIGNTKEDVCSFNNANTSDGKVELFCFGDYEEQKMLDFIQVIIERKTKVVAIVPYDAVVCCEEF